MRKILAALLLCFCLTGAEAQEGRPSVALVLGGGGARGFAHIAVLELIEEMGIPIDMIAGVSAGAIVGGLYAAGYSPAMILETMESRDWAPYFKDHQASPFWNDSQELPLAIRLGGPRKGISFERGGISSGQKVYGLFKSLTAKIPSYIDFDTLHIPFRAGAVEVPGGKFVLFSVGDMAEAIRSSMSIPGVFEPFNIDGKRYADGGVTNVLPVRELKEMGYDIIIAVDLYAPPDKYDVAPTALPDLLNTIFNNQLSEEHHRFADAVLFPLSDSVSIMNFAGGRSIYTMAKDKHDMLAALLEPVREKIFSNSREEDISFHSSAEHSGVYRDLTPIMPQSLIINGALPRDRKFIEKRFESLIKGKALTEENITAFLDKIYETGNYNRAAIRTDTRNAVACLELILFPETENKFLILAGLDFEGTLSEYSSIKAAPRAGIEYRWKDGASIFLKIAILNEISVGLSFFRPVGPYFFLSAEADLIRNQELWTKGLLTEDPATPDRLLYFRGAIKNGIRINSHNSFSFWPEYYWFKDQNITNSMAGISASYTYNKLDYSIYPSGGFHIKLENNLRFALDTAPDDIKPFDIVSMDLAGVIPLGTHFSLCTSAYGSFLFGAPGIPSDISAFSPDKIQRIHFPHAPGVFTGEKRAALALTLQFEPKESLSLFGGRMIFSMTVTGGRSGSSDWADWADIRKHGLLWNAHLGATLVLVENLSFQIRAGAGGGEGHSPAPFVSLDLGMSRFHKRLF